MQRAILQYSITVPFITFILISKCMIFLGPCIKNNYYFCSRIGHLHFINIATKFNDIVVLIDSTYRNERNCWWFSVIITKLNYANSFLAFRKQNIVNRSSSVGMHSTAVVLGNSCGKKFRHVHTTTLHNTFYYTNTLHYTWY